MSDPFWSKLWNTSVVRHYSLQAFKLNQREVNLIEMLWWEKHHQNEDGQASTKMMLKGFNQSQQHHSFFPNLPHIDPFNCTADDCNYAAVNIQYLSLRHIFKLLTQQECIIWMTSISSPINYITTILNILLTLLNWKTLHPHVKQHRSHFIPHPHAIISNALDYISLIVDSSDPNFF